MRDSRLSSYLEEEIRGVVDEHHQGADPNVVGAIRETQQENSGKVVDDLFFEILKQNMIHINIKRQKNNWYHAGRYWQEM